MAMWSLYTILLRRRPPGLNMLSFLFVLAVIGDLVVLPFWIGEMALGRYIAWTPATLAALLSVALFSSVLAYIFWNRGVEAVGAQVAGLFVHLMPVFGVILAWLFLDERLHVYHVAGHRAHPHRDRADHAPGTGRGAGRHRLARDGRLGRVPATRSRFFLPFCRKSCGSATDFREASPAESRFHFRPNH